MEIKKLISFDFDDTLVHTTLPAEGKVIWKEKTGEDWPYRAWWSRPESLDMEVFDIPLNKKIYRRYQQAISDPNNYVILATGRVKPLQDEVNIILNHYGLEFDEMHLNPGIDTFEFKSNLFAKLIDELQPEEFIMYDDRQEHLIRFVQWAKEMSCKVTIMDAISGEEFKSEQDPLIESIRRIIRQETELTERSWKGYTQKGYKTMFGKRYPNCDKENINENRHKVPSSECNSIGKLINRVMKDKYDWWKDIKINDIDYNSNKYPTIQAEITVDEEWGANQWGEFHPHMEFPGNKGWEDNDEYEQVSLGDIIGSNLAYDIRETLTDIFKYTLNFETDYMSFRTLMLIFE